MSHSCMEVKALCMRRGRREILANINMRLDIGEVLGVLGPNGAGKSSFLAACSAELPIRVGDVMLGGVSAHDQSPLSLARTRAVLSQQTSMTFDLPVTEVIAMGAYPFPEASPATVQSWIDEAIALTDLGDKASQPYHALSGGEQQRVQFARVLVQTRGIVSVQGQAFLFLDEPTASLDPRHQVQLMQIVRELATTSSIAVLIVLHDLNMAARWCDRLMLMVHGEVAAISHPKDVLNEDLLERVYGLPLFVRPHPIHPDRLIVMADG